MKEEDRKKFKLLMRRLKVTFPSNLSEQDEALRAEVYWEEFKTTAIERFEHSVLQAISSLSFFPKPAELHEFISQKSIQEYLEHVRIEHKQPSGYVDYMEPSEEGKKIASEMVSQFLGKLEQQDIESEKERTDRFEKNRAILKKQAKLLLQK
jgi:hypothetical protein